MDIKKVRDLSGQQFGRWTVVSLSERRSKTHRSAFWNVVCDCGETGTVRGDILTSGQSESCGCYKRERMGNVRRKHGKYLIPEYRVWAAMIQRCTNPKLSAFKHYGGRGITVCDRWQNSFETFYADMGPRPPDCEIDRIDNNGGYEPGNCRWVTRIQNMQNIRTNRSIEFNGKIQSLAAWAREVGLREHALSWRLKRWGIERALTTPPIRR